LVSAWVVLVNLLVMEWFYPKGEGVNRRRVQAMLAVAVAVFGAGAVRYVTVPGGEKKVFTLGQPGVDMAFLTPEEERTALANATGDLVAGAILQKSDLLVLPEGYAGRVSGDPVGTPLGFEPPVPVIMGGQRDTGVEKVYQTAYVWDREKWSFGDKTRLVVFGEFVPFRDQLPVLQNFRVPAGDLVAGTELKTLSIRGMTVGPLICFEGVFPDLAVGHSNMGAQVLVQMSIDDWYERTPAHEQLWLSTVWRSIESGLPVMRVGGRGKSLATDSRGNVVVDVPVGDRVSARAEVVVPSGSDAFGGRLWFVGVCWLACLGVAAWRKGSNMGE
jgi:apolipoprotein N-acyltransferase